MKKHMPVLALLVALSIVAGILFPSRAEAANTPGIFHNDERWYKDSAASLEMIDGIPYVPIDVFGMFDDIELSVDIRRGEFMLYNRVSGEFISILYSEKMATVNGAEEVYLNLYKLHGGYYYVPAEYFCSILSLQYEIVASGASVYGKTVRLSDGGQTKTIAELLAIYEPGGDVSTDTPPVTDRPPVSSGTDTTERTVYLTFNTVREENVYTILKALNTTGAQTTFFFTPEEIIRYPALVCAVVADGHTVALTCTESYGAEEFLAAMRAANERLYAVAKITTRIAQLPKGTEKSGFTEADVEAILAAGYVLWDYTYDVPDSMGYGAANVKSRTLEAIREREVNVLRMSTNGTVVRILPELLIEFAVSENYRVCPITAALSEVRGSTES